MKTDITKMLIQRAALPLVLRKQRRLAVIARPHKLGGGAYKAGTWTSEEDSIQLVLILQRQFHEPNSVNMRIS